MDAKSIIKTFNCKYHPNEQIQRVCSEIDCENTLCCIECILSNHPREHKESLTNISEFIEKTSKYYENLRRIKSNEDAPPLQFTDFLSKEDENLEKLSVHSEKQKAIVEQAITELLNEFTLVCHKTKEDLFRQLDAQAENLKSNYKYYKSKLNKFYSKSDEDNLNPSKEEIISKLGRAQRLEHFEFIIKNIKDDMAESRISEGTLDQKIAAIKETIKDMAETLKTQASTFPVLDFTVESNLDALLKEFKDDHVKPYFEQHLNLQNAITEFNMGNIILIDSKILKSGDQTRLLKKWIATGSVKFKLLFRGTRDGFTAQAFHDKCDKFKNTVTLVHSNHGKVFGGFVDIDWVVTNNYKNTSNAFLFSITDKEKYPVKTPGYAIYSNSGYLATFGGGFDFYLAPGCDKTNTSYSNFGHSYEMKGKAKESLVGGYNFMTKEVEVFQVEYTGTLLAGANANKGGK